MEPHEVIWQFLLQIALLIGLLIGLGLIVFSVWRSFKVPGFPNWWDASYLAAGVLLLIAAQFNQIKIEGFGEVARGPSITSAQKRQLEDIKGSLEKIQSNLAATADGTTKED